MHLISATSSELLYAVVNSAALSERDTNETHRYLQRADGELPVDFSRDPESAGVRAVPNRRVG